MTNHDEPTLPLNDRPRMTAGSTGLQFTHPGFWDCDCEELYVHSKRQRDNCPVCKAFENESPDSRLTELNESTHFFTGNDHADWLEVKNVPGIQS